jgi:hypothetical protein
MTQQATNLLSRTHRKQDVFELIEYTGHINDSQKDLTRTVSSLSYISVRACASHTEVHTTYYTI